MLSGRFGFINITIPFKENIKMLQRKIGFLLAFLSTSLTNVPGKFFIKVSKALN